MTHRVQTERFVLRELCPADCSAAYVGWLADPAINRFLETRFRDQDEASILDFIEAIAARDNEFLFGIFVANDGTHIGNIKVGPIHPLHKLADLSLFIGARTWWGRGVAREVIAALSRYAIVTLGVQKICASMYAPNAASKQAFLRAGFRQEGCRRAHYDLDGNRCDLIELGLLPSDF